MQAEIEYALSRRGKEGKKTRLLALQRLLFEAANNPETEPKDLASCARAYEVLEERLRIVDGKLKAGSYNAHSKDFPTRGKSKRVSQVQAESVSQSKPACGVTPPTNGSPEQPVNEPTPQEEKSVDTTPDT